MSLSNEVLGYGRRLEALLSQHGERLLEALRKVTNDNNGYVYDLGHIVFFNPLPGEPYLYLEIRYYPPGEFRTIGVNRKHMYGLMRVFRPITQDESISEERLRELVSRTIQSIADGLERLGIEERASK